jgi:hypothetical protein
MRLPMMRESGKFATREPPVVANTGCLEARRRKGNAMPTVEQHSWLQSAFGVVGDLAQSAEDAAGSAVQSVETTASSAVQSAENSSAVQSVENAASSAQSTASSAVKSVESAASSAQSTASSAVQSVENAASSAVQTMESVATTAVEDVKAVGTAAMQGMTNLVGDPSNLTAQIPPFQSGASLPQPSYVAGTAKDSLQGGPTASEGDSTFVTGAQKGTLLASELGDSLINAGDAIIKINDASGQLKAFQDNPSKETAGARARSVGGLFDTLANFVPDVEPKFISDYWKGLLSAPKNYIEAFITMQNVYYAHPLGRRVADEGDTPQPRRFRWQLGRRPDRHLLSGILSAKTGGRHDLHGFHDRPPPARPRKRRSPGLTSTGPGCLSSASRTRQTRFAGRFPTEIQPSNRR